MKDKFQKNRGKCLHDECSTKETECLEYIVTESGNNSLICMYCGHYPRSHMLLDDIIEPPPKKQNLSTYESSDNIDSCIYFEAQREKEPELQNKDNDLPENESSQQLLVSNMKSEIESSQNTEITQFSSKDSNGVSFIPPQFSNYVMPLLRGETMCPFIEKKSRNQLTREIQIYLDENNLISSSDSFKNRKEYSILADQISRRFGNFTWNESLSSKSHPCQSLITSLSTRRRQTRYYKNYGKRPKSTPKKALEELENLLPDEASTSKIINLLKDSYALRIHSLPVIPLYLLIKETMMCEISLRIGIESEEAIKCLGNLVDKFREITSDEKATMADIQKYLEDSTSVPERFLSLSSDPPSTKRMVMSGPSVILVQDSCFIYLKEDGRFVELTGKLNIVEATLVGFGVYHILGIEYPVHYGQFLGLLEIFLKLKKCKFPASSRSRKLVQLLQMLIINE